MEKIKNYWNTNPLQSILIIALAVRLIAVVFSGGYGWHDDHYLIIESSQSWVDGTDWDNWLPFGQLEAWPDQEPVASGHSLLYPGFHFLLFSFLKLIGITDPGVKMMIVRLLHALFSLLIVSFSYKITKHYYTEKVAKLVGLFLALLWFMPFFSVRNLVEIVCIPFLLWGFYMLLKDEKTPKVSYLFWAGFLMGIAFSIRYQTIVFTGGVGLVMLFTRKFRDSVIFGLSALLSIVIVQGGIDLIIWGKPFAEFEQYILYNLAHSGDYGTNVWYMYTTVLLGMVIPPLSLMFYFGWFRIIRKYPLLFWPQFIFFIFHNLFSNKQERFILPIMPFFIIAGAIGWWQFMDKSAFWEKNKKLFKAGMIFFWALNIIVLPIISTTYTKRSRCESMVYMGEHTNANTILLEDTNRGGVTSLPNFYAGRWIEMYKLPRPSITDSTKYTWMTNDPRFVKNIQTPEYFKYNNIEEPEYVLFFGEKRIDERIENLKKILPNLKYETTINPSYIDLLMRKITPSNNNQLVYIYKN